MVNSSLIWAFSILTFLSNINASKVSTSGRCGVNFGLTCKGSSDGNCCSQYNYCGSTSAYCGEGCQPGYGDCSGSSSPSPPDSSTKVSPDGSCAGSKGYTCLGSKSGDCCSQYNYCGSTSEYCGKGCNDMFGSCSGSLKPSSVASSAKPAGSQKVSTNGRCGSKFGGTTCLDSEEGNCCSQYDYCGSSKDYCGTGCQAGYGKCNGVSSLSSFKTSTMKTTSSIRSTTSSKFSSSSSKRASLSKTASSLTSKSASSSAPKRSSSSALKSASQSKTASSSGSKRSSSSIFVPSSSISSTASTAPSSSTYSRSITQSDTSSSVSSTTTSTSQSTSSSTSSLLLSSSDVSSSITESDISSSASSTTTSPSQSTSSSTSSLPSSSSYVPSTVSTTSSSLYSSIPSSITSSTTGSASNTYSTTLSSSSSCIGLTSTPSNAVINGGFESGVLAPWTDVTTFDFHQVEAFEPHSGTYSYVFDGLDPNPARLILTQTDINIPSGTLVDCFAFAQSQRGSGSTSFIIGIDDITCGSVTLANNGYTQFGGQVTVIGDVHTVQITIVSSGTDEGGQGGTIDDVEVTPVDLCV